MTRRQDDKTNETAVKPGPTLTVVKLTDEERRGLSTDGKQLAAPDPEKEPEGKIFINLDVMFLYFIAFVGVIVLAIKAIRWALTS